MRIESIDIYNFRQYQHLDFIFPRSKTTDLHVILATNGVGKTNFMNAILWCLYGEDPTTEKDPSKALPICNLKSLEEARKNEDDTVEVKVVVSISATDADIVFTRTSTVNVATTFMQMPEFEAKVLKKGAAEPEFFYGPMANEHVNRYVPRTIRQYFFFDGEQLHNYFQIQEQGTAHIQSSIREIAQIKIITSAKEHLGRIIQDYRRAIGRINPEVEKINKQIAEVKRDRENREDEIRQLKAANTIAKQEIARLTKQINDADTVVEDTEKYNQNEERIKALKTQLKEKKSELLAFIRKYYILLAMYPINSRTKVYIADKDVRGKLPPEVDIALLRHSLTSHICAICNQPFSEDSDAVAHMNELLSRYEVSTDVSNKLSEIKNDVGRSVEEAADYLKQKQKIIGEYSAMQKELEDKTEENAQLTVKLRRSSSSGKQVADWIEERTEQENNIEKNTIKIGSYTELINAADVRIHELEEREKKAFADVKTREELVAYKAFAEDALKIITSIETEVINDVKSQMESETMILFDELIWKKNTYGRIEFDDNFNLSLFSKKDDSSCLNSTSAAERELLALAFTIALHKVSGHDSPLFIDTPVGRVSDDNRANFAKTLVEVSKQKQIVLALTPSEYSEEIKCYFNRDTLSSSYKLGTENEEVTVMEGK